MKRWLVVALVAVLAVAGAGGACTQRGVSPPSTAPMVQPSTLTPSTPSGLTSDTLSRDTVVLRWIDNSGNEEGFRVYRDDRVIGTVGPNVTTFEDTGLGTATTYQYAVKAYNEAGESSPSMCSVKMPNPPLNVTLNYTGVNFDHDPITAGDIRLIVVVTDGNDVVQQIIPPGDGTFPLNDYETATLNQRVFHTASAGEYLKITIIAYDDDPETLLSDILEASLGVLGSITGTPVLSGISGVFSAYKEATGKALFENEDDFVGYFEGLWGGDESWGIGQYSAVGIGDFKVWFSIWSDNEPPPMPRPTMLPSVVIESIDVPTQVEVGKSYTYHVTLRNNEPRPLTVTLVVNSSVTGHVSSSPVSLPANGTTRFELRTKFEPAGVRTVTYAILYGTHQLDSVSRTVDAKSYKKEALSVNFHGWYVGTSNVNTATKGDIVIARITLSGGNPGQYAVRIGRAITWAFDETVKELSFNYDGVSVTKELSFTPPYATGEASTEGYWVQLTEGGYEVWILSNLYPPRLRVTE